MRVPDEMVEKALRAGWPEWMHQGARPMVRKALETVLPMVRERLLSGEFAAAVEEAWADAFPEDRLDAAEGQDQR